MARRKLTLRDPSRFTDPHGLTWTKYIDLQAKERARYQAELAKLPPGALDYSAVSPRYLERAIEQFANNYWPEEAATHYIATAAAHAPFEVRQ